MTSISTSNATGSLLSTLFKDWPPESVLQVASIFGTEQNDSTVYQLHNHVPKSMYHEWYAGPATWKRAVRRYLSRELFLHYSTYQCKNSREICEAVRVFDPDVIYVRVVGHPFYYLPLARRIASTTGAPVVCHIMDDYEGAMTRSKGVIERYMFRHLYGWHLRKLLESATATIGISDAMCEAFSARYGRPFYKIHNGVDADDWADDGHSTDYQRTKDKPFRIVMAGGLDDSKENQILGTLVTAIQRLNANGSGEQYEALVNVHPSSYPNAVKGAGNADGVILQRFRPVEEYRHLLQRGDALLLARNFDARSRAYTQFSFQNKLPEYMASGTPIIAVGPGWAHGVQYLEENVAGAIVKNNDPVPLMMAIRKTRHEPEQAAAMAKKAKELAFSEFDIRRIRGDFVDLMMRVAKTDSAKALR